MRIESIVIDGWMPFHGSFALELPAGPIAVVGETDGNARRSNWSGKTSLLEAVTWCLFGTHRKRLDDAVINDESDGCTVVLDLGGITASRSRARGKSTVLRLGAGSETYQGVAAQQKLEELLGHSLDDYLATGCVRQGEAESLVAMRPAARREVISGWLGLARWDAAGAVAARRSKAAADAVTRARAERDAAAQGGMSGAAFAEAEEQLAEAGRELAALRESSASSAAALERVREARLAARGAAARNEEREKLRGEVAALRAELQGRAALDAEVARFEHELADRTAAASKATEAWDELQRIVGTGFDGRCPVTCAECPVAEDVEARVRGSSEEAERRGRESSEALAALRVTREGLVAARGRLDALSRKAERYNAAARRLRDLGPAEDAGGVLQVEADFDRIEASCEAERGRIRELEALVAGLQRDLEHEARRAARADAAEKRLAAAEQEQRVAALAARALGPRGVPARVARAGVGSVEEQANALLAGTGLGLEFAWSRETQDAAPSCEDCGHVYSGKRDKVCPRCGCGRGKRLADDLELLVDDGSGQAPEDARVKSGGAKLLVGTAVRLAAAALLRGSRGSRVGWALVDEPFGPLDAEHREALARTFLGMLGAAGFEQALVVSHDAALLDAAPHRIVVERRGRRSALRVE